MTADLIAKLAAAEGPSRKLDAEIMFDLYAKPVGKKDDGGPSGYLWPEDSPSWAFGVRFPGKDRAWFKTTKRDSNEETLLIERDGALVLMNKLRIPSLTASLDAALTLVPEGWFLDGLREGRKRIIYAGDQHEPLGWFQAELQHIDGGRLQRERAKTAALALCIAALRARGEG